MHYSKLKTRKESFKNQLTYKLLSKYIPIKWIQNFDRENITDDLIQHSYRYNPTVLDRHLTRPEIANGIAHKFILNEIKNNDEMAIVFEDDSLFKKDFIHHLYTVLQKLPVDWEVVCLGGPTVFIEFPAVTLPNSIKMEFHSDEIILFKPTTPAPCTVSSMLYRKSAVCKILDSSFINPFFSSPSDHTLWLCNIQKKINMLWSQPFITYEGSKTDLFDTSLERGF